MIRSSISIVFLFLLITVNSFAQDYHSYENSVKFGKFLYNTKQYDIAIQEFERAVFLNPKDTLAYLFLFKSYNRTNQFESALKSYDRLFGHLDIKTMPASFGTEYLDGLILNNRLGEGENFVNENIYFEDKPNYRLSLLLMERKWEKANSFTSQNTEVLSRSLMNIVEQSQTIKYKKPALAASMSAIIPGSGKIYAKQWKDGVVSFLLTSLSGWLTYRAFSKYGSKNVYPWIMGAITTGYYSGNIYGSYHAAKNYNNQREHELTSKVRDILLSDY